jgi:hypothetical protein
MPPPTADSKLDDEDSEGEDFLEEKAAQPGYKDAADEENYDDDDEEEEEEEQEGVGDDDADDEELVSSRHDMLLRIHQLYTNLVLFITFQTTDAFKRV